MRRRTLNYVIAVLVACEEGIDPLPPLDPATFGCSDCHGDMDSSAPPNAIDGALAITATSVGAHRAHVTGGQHSSPVACKECHVVPATLLAPGHVDTVGPAEVIFARVARTGTAAPVWNHATARCTNTYCHGADAVLWTRVDGGHAECGSCHSFPPPRPHPADPDCAKCHATVVDANRAIIGRMLHANGLVDTATTATSTTMAPPPSTCSAGCHGSRDDTAPPSDTNGGMGPAVGAHQAHLQGNTLERPVACTTCHDVPGAVGDPGHIDPSPAEIVFSGPAGPFATYDPSTKTCASTYCHQGARPTWTDATNVTCGSCHGFPPPSPHPSSTSCGNCHSTAGAGMTVDPRRHIDGRLDF